jgi:hypothetical protein
VPYSFLAGLWRLEEGELKFTGKTEYRISKMEKDEILFIPSNGALSYGAIIMRKRCQDYRFKLTSSTEALIDKFLALKFKDKEAMCM